MGQGVTTGTTYQIISLTAGTTYSFRVKTTCSGGGQSVASNTVTATPTNPPITLNLGTQMLKNNLTYEESYFTYVNGKTLFVANDNSTGRELWVTDNTPAGTVLLKDIEVGSNGSIIDNFKVVGNVLYFTAYTSSLGIELWRSDGTVGGTYLVKDIYVGSTGSEPRGLEAHNGYLYFFASNGTGHQLWRSDGTAAGTVAVTSVSGNLWGEKTFSTGTIMYFAGESTSIPTTELWRSDGTAAGTYLVKDINPTSGSGGMNPTGAYFTVLNSSITLFIANNGSGQGLWRTDGTATGTFSLCTGTVGTLSDFRKIVTMNGIAYFSLNSGGDIELWRSDGTVSGTYLVKNINPTGSSMPINLAAMSNTLLLFSANNGSSGHELWKSDGTSTGTVLVEDIIVGSSNGINSGNSGIKANSRYWFQAEKSTFGLGSSNLSATDGTTRAVVRVVDCGVEAYIDMSTIANVNEKVMYLLNKNGVYELWNTCSVTYPTVSNISGTVGQSSTLTASNCNTCTWYADNSCGVALATGSSYTTPTLTGTTTYYVSNTLNGCESPRLPITISAKTDGSGIMQQQFQLYPNPTQSQTTLQYHLPQATQVQVMVHDMAGKQVIAKDLGKVNEGTQQEVLNTAHLPNGTYIVQLLPDNSNPQTAKLVIAK